MKTLLILLFFFLTRLPLVLVLILPGTGHYDDNDKVVRIENATNFTMNSLWHQQGMSWQKNGILLDYEHTQIYQSEEGTSEANASYRTQKRESAKDPDVTEHRPEWTIHLALILVLIQSMVNPVLYGLMSKAIRTEFRIRVA